MITQPTAMTISTITETVATPAINSDASLENSLSGFAEHGTDHRKRSASGVEGLRNTLNGCQTRKPEVQVQEPVNGRRRLTLTSIRIERDGIGKQIAEKDDYI